MDFPYIVNLCYIINDKNQVLLQKKRRGFGAGKWNGPGGKINPEEEIVKSVIREVEEETTIKIVNPVKMAELEFIFHGKEEINNYCHVFVAHEFKGEPIDTGEGDLEWFDIDQIPLDQMWEDDRFWLPDILSGKKVNMRFNFDADQKLIDFDDLNKKKPENFPAAE